MNARPMFTSEENISTLLRRRRLELGLLQSDIAQDLNVTPEAVVLWEAGRRRMELCKVPRLAAALNIDVKELCAKALAEFHPAFFAALFAGCGDERANMRETGS